MLFIIYMNDLPNVLEFCNIALYADDTVLYFLLETYNRN